MVAIVTKPGLSGRKKRDGLGRRGPQGAGVRDEFGRPTGRLVALRHSHRARRGPVAARLRRGCGAVAARSRRVLLGGGGSQLQMSESRARKNASGGEWLSSKNTKARTKSPNGSAPQQRSRPAPTQTATGSGSWSAPASTLTTEASIQCTCCDVELKCKVQGATQPEAGGALPGLVRAASISEFVLLAEICLVQVPGSVEEERMFSAMNYIKNFLRNRLAEQHLNVAARLFQQRRYTLSNFPYARLRPSGASKLPVARECLKVGPGLAGGWCGGWIAHGNGTGQGEGKLNKRVVAAGQDG
jgi:hypothetical protein